MRLTDGKKTVDIKIRKWDGSGYGPDWSHDYFGATELPYDAETDAYTVKDVDYCIDMANDEGPEGARSEYDENGNPTLNEDIHIFVDEVQ